MADKEFLVVFRSPQRAVQHVIASSAKIHGDHLVLVDAEGKLVALFLLEIVESWKEI
jgi:hypothetical protein